MLRFLLFFVAFGMIQSIEGIFFYYFAPNWIDIMIRG